MASRSYLFRSQRRLLHRFRAGANVFVAGTAIFGSKSPADTIAQMRAAAQKHLA
jgi:pentose-5-phosphate-3-epimerase